LSKLVAAHLRTIAGATLRGMLIAIRDQSRPGSGAVSRRPASC
jgi:hypothetical protein